MAMSEDHREILRKNRVFLINDVHIDEDLLSRLMATDSKVLTSDMKDNIKCKKNTSKERVGLLLDILPKRGKMAFEEFIKALVETSQSHLAEKLDSQLTKYYTDIEKAARNAQVTPPPEGKGDSGGGRTMDPDKALNEKVSDIYENKDILANVPKVTDADIISYLEAQRTQSAYKLMFPERGLAVIFSNEFFTDARLERRLGNKLDVDNLACLFKMLQFEVEPFSDLTDTQVYEHLEKLRARVNQNPVDVLVICLLSHGVDGHIFAMNSKQISIEKVVSYFEADKCPGLRGKPKIFLVQACQTVRHEAAGGNVAAASLSLSRPVQATDAAIGVDMHDGGSTSTSLSGFIPESLDSIVHSKADVLIARSTVSGDVANRHTEYGSLFIRCIVYVLSRKAHRDHLVDMLTEVTNIMSHTKTARGDIQLSERRDTFSKKLYLMPGWDPRCCRP